MTFNSIDEPAWENESGVLTTTLRQGSGPHQSEFESRRSRSWASSTCQSRDTPLQRSRHGQNQSGRLFAFFPCLAFFIVSSFYFCSYANSCRRRSIVASLRRLGRKAGGRPRPSKAVPALLLFSLVWCEGHIGCDAISSPFSASFPSFARCSGREAVDSGGKSKCPDDEAPSPSPRLSDTGGFVEECSDVVLVVLGGVSLVFGRAVVVVVRASVFRSRRAGGEGRNEAETASLMPQTRFRFAAGCCCWY
jgi:hypothetical protein